MPALFDVPGWSVPSAPVSTHRQSKKRKRTLSSDELDLFHNAQANIEKLIHSFDGNATLSDDAANGSSKEKKKQKQSKSKRNKPASQPSRQKVHSQSKPPTPSAVDPPTPSNNAPLPKKNAKKKDAEHAVQDTGGLTPLQQSLKKSLDGARFRMLNETLYKSNSLEAVRMIKEDPTIFEDYHTGFRRQVHSWPSNPVSHYVSELSCCPAKTVIADLGCGDAALARALLQKNLIVLSFDLVSDGIYVTEADICSRVPLPGSEPQSAEPVQGEGQIVDVVVCALSLMSTNWLKCIREAWRILRPGGKLMIAEVASRFTSVDEFVSLIRQVGFKLEKKDDSNSHFTLFRFKKVAKTVVLEQEWTAFVTRGRVLKSCEYKKR